MCYKQAQKFFILLTILYFSGVGGFIARPGRGRGMISRGGNMMKQRQTFSSIAKMGSIGQLPAQPGECK